jgi:hypothetical protein
MRWYAYVCCIVPVCDIGEPESVRAPLLLYFLFNQMAPDGKLSTVQKVKLSMKCEAGVQQAAWVGSSQLATSSAEEPYIR